jgi:hypothetical protein
VDRRRGYRGLRVGSGATGTPKHMIAARLTLEEAEALDAYSREHGMAVSEIIRKSLREIGALGAAGAVSNG